ncbi:hypothetical protein K402DRAFT_332971 [Aulographum hederae CBS 113979]|uniref:CAP-Gly domain-containing protein n=1 Tax=Aulographum hederae CBS 113979 TaxID=1176131 RepID=A0A6G1GZ80_9PEZI|nr:hypothetical protein K402DRAFT_332971 [Aulographum hederae CBS 113979]
MVGGDGRDIEMGDAVNVPGGMHGTIKFIGAVRNKNGVFAGVELSKEYASRGKNDGDVEGVRYFTTLTPGSGIFLPIHRATKRSPSSSSESPHTPSLSSSSDGPNLLSHTMPKFSQSIGPGARAPSPMFKPKGRPSLPRPASPLRKQSNVGQTPAREGSLGSSAFSRSQIGTHRFTPSPAPGRTSNVKSRPPTTRPFSRNNSRLGSHAASPIDDDASTPTPAGTIHLRNGSHPLEDEVKKLKAQLEDRDKHLREQASSLAEMESSLTELQGLIPDGEEQGRMMRNGGFDDQETAQLRAMLREKNDKIAVLTNEFDSHRAEFRQTIDTLEMASTETVRIYEAREAELMKELRDMHERGDDVDSVARQLRQLEDLVQELEEGLEDARRGEAEARGEVEFLRGEVERGRSELLREREKAAAALAGVGVPVDGGLGQRDSREVEQRDDEIRGLKAIIHSLSSGPDTSTPTQEKSSRNGALSGGEGDEVSSMKAMTTRLEREKKELQGLIERKAYREEELEREIERLLQLSGAPDDQQRTSVISNAVSDRTAVQEKRSSGRDSKGTILSWRGSPQAHRRTQTQLAPMYEVDNQSSADESSSLWCEVCETGGHDILKCTNVDETSRKDGAVRTPESTTRTGKDAVFEGLRRMSASSGDADFVPRNNNSTASKLGGFSGSPPSAPLPNPYDSGLVAGVGGVEADPNMWCALCERDGHNVTACPFEDTM